MSKLLLLLVACLSTQPVFAQNALFRFQETQKQADQAYNNGSYAHAYKLYQLLNEAGDKFSAFRIATMYEDGLHVEQSLVEAYAWSFLAAESGRQKLRAYHEDIKKRLHKEQLTMARERAGALIEEFGMFSYAMNSNKTLHSMLKQCAGSRVGNTCDKISVSWPGCDISVGNGQGNDTDRLPSVDCLRIGSLGLSSYNVMPSTIRAVQKGLNEYINEYNPGRVELGDFELIDE
ncbi:MAG: hypothetical protein KKC01_09180 [Gammaproteobacteria bacterium]|nr:hypothetical protein [Gammaproteobacteria bacterium]